jgi:hypothetical protein
MYKDCFKMMDINKDGVIDKNDLRGAFDNVGVLMTESELDGLLGEISGACTYDNMVKMFQEKMAGGKLVIFFLSCTAVIICYIKHDFRFGNIARYQSTDNLFLLVPPPPPPKQRDSPFADAVSKFLLVEIACCRIYDVAKSLAPAQPTSIFQENFPQHFSLFHGEK